VGGTGGSRHESDLLYLNIDSRHCRGGDGKDQDGFNHHSAKMGRKRENESFENKISAPAMTLGTGNTTKKMIAAENVRIGHSGKEKGEERYLVKFKELIPPGV